MLNVKTEKQALFNKGYKMNFLFASLLIPLLALLFTWFTYPEILLPIIREHSLPILLVNVINKVLHGLHGSVYRVSIYGPRHILTWVTSVISSISQAQFYD